MSIISIIMLLLIAGLGVASVILLRWNYKLQEQIKVTDKALEDLILAHNDLVDIVEGGSDEVAAEVAGGMGFLADAIGFESGSDDIESGDDEDRRKFKKMVRKLRKYGY